MNIALVNGNSRFDKPNAIIAVFVLIFSFIIYRLTVQPTLSFWDCGEFIACSYILGVPHPPGFPLYVAIGRIFSILPIAADICLRVNLLSVVSSSFTAFFGYLLLVKIMRHWYKTTADDIWKRVIIYLGALTGSLFLAFSATNWGNSVEAEVYGLSMMILTIIFWLAIKYYECQGTPRATRLIYLICYLGILGVSIHLTSFLIVPIAAMFVVLNKDATSKAWLAIGIFFVAELLAIIVFADGRGGYPAFIFATLVMLGTMAVLVYKYINWPVLIGIGAFSLIMVGFYQFVYALIGGVILLLLLARFGPKKYDWKKGIIIILVAVIGFSFHLFIPIRSGLNPSIDENNASRDFRTFVNYLERKQYGSQSMTDRMFVRRGTMAHQFGRHAHMGFWSYFEHQYGMTEIFGLLFLLGLYGIWFAVKKKLQIGLPFLLFILFSSVGLVLYMNFADGIKYDAITGDAYLEVRNRDYFFTPAFTYFGLALGLGMAALLELVRSRLSAGNFSSYKKPALAAMSLMVLLPGFTIAHNYFECDRSNNYYPYIYAHNILENCEENAVLFTAGDNDTFPVWCVQEVYGMRKDVRVVNLSLLNTDWYIYQMKHKFDVPISLEDNQILWDPYEFQGQEILRPKEPFRDRPRKRMAYLIPVPHEGRVVKLQDMMVDEIILENKWKDPVYGSSEPYDESPLKLNDLTYSEGVLYRTDKNVPERNIDADRGYYLFKEVFMYDGLDDPNIYKDDNATGVFLALGFNALRISTEFRTQGDRERAREILELSIEKYPEFFQAYDALANMYKEDGDSVRAREIYLQADETISRFLEKNPDNQFYMQDLGLARHYLGKTDEAVDLLWGGFLLNPNSGYAYRKLIQFLYETQRSTEFIRATRIFASYKINLGDPLVQQVLSGMQSRPEVP